MLINIKKYVDIEGISKSELARKLDISYPTMLSLYNGEASSIRLDTLEDLCIILKCTPNDIFHFEKRPTAYDSQQQLADNQKTPIYETLLTYDPNLQFEIIRLPDGQNIGIPYLKQKNNDKSDTPQ